MNWGPIIYLLSKEKIDENIGRHPYIFFTIFILGVIFCIVLYFYES